MLSRVADSLYWMSRYLERAEHTARLLDVSQHTLLDLGGPFVDQAQRWRLLLQAIGELEDFYVARPAGDTSEAMQFMTLDTGNHNSIISCVASARENARQVREQISSEMWEQVNSLYLQLRSPAIQQRWFDEPHVFYRIVKEGSHLFQGITDATLTQSEGWQFIQLGRFLERAIQTARLIRLHVPLVTQQQTSSGPQHYLELVALLKSCTSFEAYTRQYRAVVRPQQVAEFMLLHPTFPRSVRFCAGAVKQALQAIAETTGRQSFSAEAERLAGRLRATLDYAQIQELINDGLEPFLDHVQRQCFQIDVHLQRAYIHYTMDAAVMSS